MPPIPIDHGPCSLTHTNVKKKRKEKAHTCHPNVPIVKQEDCHELKVSLSYRVNSGQNGLLQYIVRLILSQK